MKKIICLVLTVALVFTTADIAFAKKHSNDKNNKNDKKQESYEEKDKSKDKEQEFKTKDSPVFQYGNYKLPIAPITKGMGATVSFDKNTAVLTVTKDAIKIEINFKEKSVYVNGVKDNNSGIFSAKKEKKMVVIIKYIAEIFGIRCDIDDDDIIIEVPDLDAPTNITIAPMGGTVATNTLNSTTLYMTASAKITAGKATGGRAELYVGNKLVAVDNSIGSTDTNVTFTTSDGTPTNSELQSIVPSGGSVSVKLYNAYNNSVTSTSGNPTLNVDYVAPSLASITSVIYNVPNNQLYLIVTGAGSVGDKVDVSKLTLYDSNLGRSYQLSNNPTTGSTGTVISSTSILVNLGTVDKVNLSGFGTTTVYLTVASGALLSDAAGNISSNVTSSQSIAVTVVK